MISKKVFKQKTSVKEELTKALEEKITLNYSQLAKRVGISVHRVRKYCKNHNIDLADLNAQSIAQPLIKKESTTKKKSKKINLGESQFKKIDLGVPKDIRIKLEED